MEKHTNRLFKKERDWDLAIIFVTGKNPIMMESDVDISLIDGGKTIAMKSSTPHPAPQKEEDTKKLFIMETYMDIAQVYAVDYYTEKRIATKPKGGGLIKM